MLLRSKRARSSPISFEDWGGGCPRTSDPFVVANVPTPTESGPLTRLRIVPFDRGGYMRLGVIGNQDHRSTSLPSSPRPPRPTPFSSERQP